MNFNKAISQKIDFADEHLALETYHVPQLYYGDSFHYSSSVIHMFTSDSMEQWPITMYESSLTEPIENPFMKEAFVNILLLDSSIMNPIWTEKCFAKSFHAYVELP